MAVCTMEKFNVAINRCTRCDRAKHRHGQHIPHSRSAESCRPQGPDIDADRTVFRALALSYSWPRPDTYPSQAMVFGNLP